jgi:hypothetical protein
MVTSAVPNKTLGERRGALGHMQSKQTKVSCTFEGSQTSVSSKSIKPESNKEIV